MNTLLLAPALFSSDGGIERIMRLYVRALGELAGAGDRVHAVVLNDRTNTPPALADYATPALASVAACGRNKLACLWHTLRLARQSDRVICGHVNLLRVAHLARRLVPRLKIALVAHGIEVWRDFTAAERRALATTPRILCVSDYTRRQLLQRCPELRPVQLVVQPNALDPQFAAPAPNPAATQRGLILSVARLNAAEAYKGIDHLIEALPTVRSLVSSARLRIVGDGDDRSRLENLAARSGVAEHIEFTGRIDDAVLREHFAACELFALPSRGEGFGLVYLEALAHGKPCLAADTGGAPEIVNASCGVLVPFGDVPALAQATAAALRRAWDPDALRARAAEFSYEAFRRRLASAWQN
jgi:glycosyltransferase involved in cell wall biosynthesis